MLHGWLLTRLWYMNRARSDFLAVVLFLLLHFFVVRDIAWISHERFIAWVAAGPCGIRACLSVAESDLPGWQR